MLEATPGAWIALIVFDGATASAEAALRQAFLPVLAISLTDLLEQMRESSFAEVVRRLRNQAVHGSRRS